MNRMGSNGASHLLGALYASLKGGTPGDGRD
jgi:hypothetical protein